MLQPFISLYRLYFGARQRHDAVVPWFSVAQCDSRCSTCFASGEAPLNRGHDGLVTPPLAEPCMTKFK